MPNKTICLEVIEFRFHSQGFAITLASNMGYTFLHIITHSCNHTQTLVQPSSRVKTFRASICSPEQGIVCIPRLTLMLLFKVRHKVLASRT
uniref:Pyrophosphatefructose 6-phosphate 1-phosphotransferase subunit alpha-like n=1 Tax=Rhizophora mucronata TaxID=61149 RepID=A0A2P2JTB7_RHIMU